MASLLRATVVSLLLLTVTGCSAPPTSGQAAPGPSSSDAAVGAPAAFTSREVLPSCGVIELDQGESVPQDAFDCLAEAASTGGAELAVTAPTTEGDPFVQYYRITDAGLEIWTDSTLDRFGGKDWALMTCPGATSVEGATDCTDS